MAKTLKIQLSVRKIARNKYGEFCIYEQRQDVVGRKKWHCISRGYEHKTSADAALGRMHQREVMEVLIDGEDN